MATLAERKRRKRARSQTATFAAASPKLAEPKIATKREPERKPGLQWLLSKGKITPAMCHAGDRYATGVRVASCIDASAIRGCLASLEGIRGSGAMVPMVRSVEELEAAEWVAEFQRQTIYIRTRLFHDVELMAVLDAIAIRQLTPREITQVQREAEVLEGVAYTVLKLLVGILKDYDNMSRPEPVKLSCAA